MSRGGGEEEGGRRGEYTRVIVGGKIPIPRSRRGWRFSRVFERENVKIQAYLDIGEIEFAPRIYLFNFLCFFYFSFFHKCTGLQLDMDNSDHRKILVVIKLYFYLIEKLDSRCRVYRLVRRRCMSQIRCSRVIFGLGVHV